ncbi:acyl-CoA dehydratase activase-related protein [Heliophilum fasciatum]|uniref:Putative nucleotide-binding protein (Sugar kinase/HSP70/actin superfamily) n=1 Tax=Heliophilum fasciatum TaxID=35700 RepID=A0A4R2RV45_9FIRM|nr:acyl-CoA dehydratase activase-related protein [Heliophilum fasciatum]MCW2277372.1 putative nucleotide-binding protein (sugar kinase/HSP70/actin superfamily) [Heliophilum fasciatum]TCP67208.1 putative nucleotide-binding protein (sugar kinase/HSP70/actin superfamily) [Heliophilum fasciatum]
MKINWLGLAQSRPRPTVIGIPRGLAYYEYLPLWRAFFEAMGCQVLLSPVSNPAVLAQGKLRVVDEACSPVKIFFGHVYSLQGKVDHIFVPRLISVQEGTYLCPKFLGLPDMLRSVAALGDEQLPLLTVDVNCRQAGGGWSDALRTVGKQLGVAASRVRYALQTALAMQAKYESQIQSGMLLPEALAPWEKAGTLLLQGPPVPGKPVRKNQPINLPGEEGPTVVVVGHPYVLFDPLISMGLITKLRKRAVAVRTVMTVDGEEAGRATEHLPKRLFWSFGQQLLGGALHWMGKPLEGMIFVAPFGCGPDSLIGDLVERFARREGNLPFLLLTVDEHGGDAGMETRLDAFLDVIEQKRQVRSATVPV